MRIRTATAVLLPLMLGACMNPFLERRRPSTPSAPEKSSGALVFADVSERLFLVHCTRCHAHYSTYEAVVRDIAEIRSSIETERMPKNSPPLDSGTRELLAAWIDGGMKRSHTTGDLPPAPPSLKPDWPSLSTSVFSPKCIACHNPSGQARFLDLTTRQAIFAARDKLVAGTPLIDFDQPDESGLLTILRDEEEPMPPAESNLPRLNEEEIRTIREWIALGLP